MTDEMLAHGTWRIGDRVVTREEGKAAMAKRRGGRPVLANPHQQVTIGLPADVLARWKASGPGWQTRMAEFLSRKAPNSAAQIVRGRPWP